jgi:SpoVK/Ycf46/Vps4 family AAA+-type ATPase
MGPWPLWRMMVVHPSGRGGSVRAFNPRVAGDLMNGYVPRIARSEIDDWFEGAYRALVGDAEHIDGSVVQAAGGGGNGGNDRPPPPAFWGPEPPVRPPSKNDFGAVYGKVGPLKSGVTDTDKNLPVEEFMEKEFKRVVGQEKIKNQLRQFLKKTRLDEVRFSKDENRLYHMVFSGPPGTGKTSMAKLVAKLMLKMKITKSDELVVVGNSLDLLASYVGQTAGKVDSFVTKAKGGVLFIDEAYSIVRETGDKSNAFGREAIDTIMKHLDPPSCMFIFAGYEKPMDLFLRANEGMARRIPYRFTFESYSKSELVEILKIMAESKSEVIAKGDLDVIARQIDLFSADLLVTQNAGLMSSWLAAAQLERDASVSVKEVKKNRLLGLTLKAEHFIAAAEKIDATRVGATAAGFFNEGESKMTPEQLAGVEFSKIIGQEILKEQLMKFIKKARLDELRATRGAVTRSGDAALFHMVFSGPPGTGKTTMARVVAKLMLRMKLVDTDRIVFVSNARDLVGQVQGQTRALVDSKVEEARGGVLFIDEAYTLVSSGGSGASRTGSQFGAEAVDTIMKHLDPPACMFIFAGYEDQMNEFLETNQGLARRIPYRFAFAPYTRKQLVEIFIKMATERKEVIEREALYSLSSLVAQVQDGLLASQNAGFISNWLSFAQVERDAQLDYEEAKRRPELLNTLSLSHIKSALAKIEQTAQ